MKLPRRVPVGWKIVCFGWGWEVEPWYFPKEKKNVSKGLLQENCNKNILISLLPTWKADKDWASLDAILHATQPFSSMIIQSLLPPQFQREAAELKSVFIFLMTNWKLFSDNFFFYFATDIFSVENNSDGKFTMDLVCYISFSCFYIEYHTWEKNLYFTVVFWILHMTRN